jgi:hypothetical protein
MIKSLNEIEKKFTLFEKDSNGREINVYQLKNVVVVGESSLYPNILFKSIGEDNIYNPINERTMSLKDAIIEYEISPEKPISKKEDNDLFFFVYNTDNYFHFVYDSLPYLITYKKLLLENPNLKLLMGYPNPNKKGHYNFVIEFLELLGITEDDIIIIDNKTQYNSVYISTSYTHDFDSNLPPRNEVYDFLQDLINDVKYGYDYVDYPKKIYVSRRTWKHNNLSNIGTNYTTRRKMMNEDTLVELLESKGYTEIFTELLTTKEKILLFSNVESVIGAIGGGLCNVLFSNKNCNLISLISPNFLDINQRFKHCFKNVNTTYFQSTELYEKTDLKKYMRVKVGNIVGEIIDISGDLVTISYSDINVSGWNNDVRFKQKIVKSNECFKLDNGLNSSWLIDLEKLKEINL